MRLVRVSGVIVVAFPLCVVVRIVFVMMGTAFVFLDEIEAHFEDIVCLIVVSETFFLLLCVDVTQFLASG